MTSIRTALAVMFGMLAIVTGLQGIVTFEQLLKAEHDVDSVVERQLASLAAIRDISGSVLRLQSKQFRLVLSEALPLVVENNIREVQNELDDLQGARQRYEALVASAEERVLFDRITTKLDQYLTLSGPVSTLMRGRQSEATALLLKPWLRVLFRSVDAMLQSEINLIENRARANSMAGVAALTRAKRVALLAGLAAAGLAALALVISDLRILRPLGTVTRALNQLAAGDIHADSVLSRRRDEIGAIGRAVEAFRTSLIRTRLAEADQAQTQLFVANIAASTPDGMIAFDDAGVITFWNHAAETLLGVEADAVIGASLDTVIGKHAWLSDRSGDAQHGTFETEFPHRSGEPIPFEISFSRWTQGSRTLACAILRDIRSRRRDQAALSKLAHTDALTGLPNRIVLMAQMTAALARGRPFAVMILDLDHFKQVNDAFGHQVGDEILRLASQRLVACVGAADVVTRIGGDEFIVLLDGNGDPIEAARVADAMVRSLGEPFLAGQQTIHLGTSIGFALSPGQSRDPEELVSYADLALYAAKADGRHSHRLFTPDLRGAAMRDSLCRQQLPRAVEQGEFTLVFQPQVRLSDGTLEGAEALIRWQHPDFGLLAPDAFISVLESSPFAEEVGNWVIGSACRQAARWRSVWPDFRIGVNLSGAHFRSGRLAETVRGILEDCDLPPSALEIEITEHVILRHDDTMIAPLRELHDLGVSIAFDDYGTGYASLSFLKRFPLSRLKIDRSFVRSMRESSEDAAIIRMILMLGHSLGLDVIAEGIETTEQADLLQREGCRHGQGYLYGRPLPADMFEARFCAEIAALPRSA